MTPRKLLEYLVAVVVLVLAGSLLLGQLLGQPVFLSYVETGSMQPTLAPGDGFIAVPMAIAGDIEEGDVIVFDAQNINDGGLVTHRVVDRTGDGFITKGDANPVADQDGREPPVQRAQVVAKALQIGDTVVVIPNLGVVVLGMSGLLSALQQRLAALLNTRALLGTQGLAYLLFALGVASYLVSELFGDRSGRDRRRSVERRRQTVSSRLIIGVLTLLVVSLLTASMVVPAGTQDFSIVSSTNDAPGPSVVEVGTSESFQYRVPSNGILPVVVFLEPASDGISVEPTEVYVPGNTVREAIVEVRAPGQTGFYPRYLVEYRYLAFLPRGMIRTLFEIHPWLPIIVIDLLIGIGFAGIGIALFDTGRTRVRSRDVSFVYRVRRWFK